jgi:CopA family copper-resistance protein
VRLRVINGSSMTYFDVRIPGLKLTMVAADGQDVEPVSVDEFRIAPAEVYDAIVTPTADRAWTIFAQAMDRSGYACGTLAPRPGMRAEVPAVEPRPILNMVDMGMSMNMSHAPGAAMDGSHAGMNATDSSTHAGHAGMKSSPLPPKFGPGVDMVVAAPRTDLDDPGIGLRNNGRRVLTYADLHTIGGPIDSRPAGREIQLRLTGHMERFMWSFNGEKFSESQPLQFRYGERLRLTLINDTMMFHPIHLHGMWSEIESPQGDFLVRKHTLTVQPAQQLSYLVTADALGRWAYHCHMLYHMEAGMFREVVVAAQETGR